MGHVSNLHTSWVAPYASYLSTDTSGPMGWQHIRGKVQRWLSDGEWRSDAKYTALLFFSLVVIWLLEGPRP
jgi:hypothetical protein